MADRHELNARDLTAESIGGDAVILNLANGVYYGLHGAGGFAFAMLEHGHTVEETRAALAERYGIDSERAETDVAALLQRLLDEGILTTANGGAPRELPADALPEEGDYATPELERYDDMGDLMAVDPPMPGIADTPWQSPRN